MAGSHTALSGLDYLCFGLTLQSHGEEPGNCPVMCMLFAPNTALGGENRCWWRHVSAVSGECLAGKNPTSAWRSTWDVGHAVSMEAVVVNQREKTINHLPLHRGLGGERAALLFGVCFGVWFVPFCPQLWCSARPSSCWSPRARMRHRGHLENAQTFTF